MYRCLSRLPWLRNQWLARNLTVLDLAFELLYGPLWWGDYLLGVNKKVRRMSQDEDVRRGMEAIEKQFGSRIQFLFHQLQYLAVQGQVCDITVYNAKPHLNVKVKSDFFYALMYGAGAAKLAEMLSAIGISNGATVSIKEIWTINPMPSDGFTEKELAAVDLAEGEEKIGPNGETLRKMTSDTYHCASRDEEDRFLRRFIAS